MYRLYVIIFVLGLAASTMAAQDSLRALRVEAREQQTFPQSVPAGNYSGIAWLGGERYAVVSDKAESDGFFLFRISLDSLSGRIDSVACLDFRPSGLPNRDEEGIAFSPHTGKVYISGEEDNAVLEYSLDGKPTGRRLAVPSVFATAAPNLGLEALTYNAITHTFWTTSESCLPQDGQPASPTNRVKNRLRMQSFGDNLLPLRQYIYETDTPEAPTSNPLHYTIGVSSLCALDDGRLLVLEREVFITEEMLGSYVNCKLYLTNPAAHKGDETLEKTLLTEFRTAVSLLSQDIANYEGMCLGPRLADGRRVLLMLSDSQNQAGGTIKDWFKVMVIGRGMMTDIRH